MTKFSKRYRLIKEIQYLEDYQKSQVSVDFREDIPSLEINKTKGYDRANLQLAKLRIRLYKLDHGGKLPEGMENISDEDLEDKTKHVISIGSIMAVLGHGDPAGMLFLSSLSMALLWMIYNMFKNNGRRAAQTMEHQIALNGMGDVAHATRSMHYWEAEEFYHRWIFARPEGVRPEDSELGREIVAKAE